MFLPSWPTERGSLGGQEIIETLLDPSLCDERRKRQSNAQIYAVCGSILGNLPIQLLGRPGTVRRSSDALLVSRLGLGS